MSLLREKTALILGAGGMGGSAALTLASAGVGRIVLAGVGAVDTVDLSGHPLLREADLGAHRGAAAARRLGKLFPEVELEVPEGDLDVPALARRADVIVDASNHFPTMFLANDAAAAAGRPLVHGGLLHLTAQLLTVLPGVTGCLRCLFEGPPPPGPEAGAFGPLAGFAGSLAGAEATRLLEDRPGAYVGRLLLYEARTARTRSVPVGRRAGCVACAPAPVPPEAGAP